MSKLEWALVRLTERLTRIYDALTPCTAFMLYSGSGDLRKISRLQKQVRATRTRLAGNEDDKNDEKDEKDEKDENSGTTPLTRAQTTALKVAELSMPVKAALQTKKSTVNGTAASNTRKRAALGDFSDVG
ncbi:hypothetical protein FNYG_14837 [Fusarium nygamai]|uniref:Uncharacterized protein n=1 Tax=Gibberella nygamai TaxID=42673 RepID=A0A2K0UPJ5_GIBNY|nr:hypothetical protein FNYG_14837 [Fusarium nygamai]